MILSDYTYAKPKNAAELFGLMRQEGSYLLAGGTDLVLLMREGKIEPKQVIDIKAVAELRGIYEEGGGVFFGAAEFIQTVVEHPLAQRFGALVQGAGRIGCYEIRWRATLGGNICNGSPSADSVPGLLLYNAEAILISEGGERRLPLEAFLLGPGRVDLQPVEVLRGVFVKNPPAGADSRYYRLSRVKGMDLSGLSAAVYCEGLSNFRLALGAAWPTVARGHKAEEILNAGPFTDERFDEAMKALLETVNPRRSSMRASPEYKKAMIPVLLRQGIDEMNGGGVDG